MTTLVDSLMHHPRIRGNGERQLSVSRTHHRFPGPALTVQLRGGNEVSPRCRGLSSGMNLLCCFGQMLLLHVPDKIWKNCMNYAQSTPSKSLNALLICKTVFKFPKSIWENSLIRPQWDDSCRRCCQPDYEIKCQRFVQPHGCDGPPAKIWEHDWEAGVLRPQATLVFKAICKVQPLSHVATTTNSMFCMWRSISNHIFLHSGFVYFLCPSGCICGFVCALPLFIPCCIFCNVLPRRCLPLFSPSVPMVRTYRAPQLRV